LNVRGETKAALLDAAKQLVGERGYAGTSVRDLAAATGANVAAVNYHFGSRDELLDQAVLESFLEWTDRVAGAAQSQPTETPLERLAACARTAMQELPDAQRQFAAFLEAVLQARRSGGLRERLAAHYAEQRRRVGEIVGLQQEHVAMPPETLDTLASLLIATIDGLLLQALLDPAAIPTAEQLDALARTLAGVAGDISNLLAAPEPQASPTPGPDASPTPGPPVSGRREG
jgi:AcrR family transcriptional regulator